MLESYKAKFFENKLMILSIGGPSGQFLTNITISTGLKSFLEWLMIQCSQEHI